MDPSVIQANIDVHTRMASVYNQVEPHFRPENQAKVRRNLQELRGRCRGGKLLDLGCGTGFILQLAVEYFDELHGVDVTPAMLSRVDTSSGKIVLHNLPAEKLPFENDSFDLVTAYSFLHHLSDYRVVLKEVQRVLKPGGMLYADLEPNKLFWESMVQIESLPADHLRPWVEQARASVLSTDAKVEQEFGIPKEVFRQAEYSKAILGGFDPQTIAEETHELGFRSADVRLEWYVGQAHVMHRQSFEDSEIVENYLRGVSPLSDHLFKYVQFVLTK